MTPTFMLTGQKADPTKPLRPQLARMLTGHPQFARATVNLIWKELFGLGIVDPVDSFDLSRQNPKAPPPRPWTVQPTNPALLQELAALGAPDIGVVLGGIVPAQDRERLLQLGVKAVFGPGSSLPDMAGELLSLLERSADGADGAARGGG